MAKKNREYGIPDKQMIREYCSQCKNRYFSADDLCCKDCCHNPIEQYRGEINKQELNTSKSKGNR